MPLYDCMFLFKPVVQTASIVDLVARVGRHVYSKNGVLTDIKAFGTVQLGYGIKKLDGRHFQGKLLQVTMMATPSINKELQYLNKEDRLLRWLLVKHRNVEIGAAYLADKDGRTSRSSIYDEDSDEFKREEETSDDDDDEEYDGYVEQGNEEKSSNRVRIQ